MKVDKVTNPLPINFKEFSKNPVVGTMFIVIVGISALYIDIRSTFHGQIEAQGNKIEKLENKMDTMSQSLIKCESSMSGANAKLSTLESLGKIEKIK